MTPHDLISLLRSKINPAYAAQSGTESYERRLCAEALESLIAENAALRVGQRNAMTDYKSMFEQAVRTLAAIDEALGIGDDGCGAPDQTLTAIAELKEQAAGRRRPKRIEVTTKIELPEPAAHMYPSDLDKFKSAETFAQAYSVAVGKPDERSVPLFTLSDMIAYAESAIIDAERLRSGYREILASSDPDARRVAEDMLNA